MPEYIPYYQPNLDRNILHAPSDNLTLHLSPRYPSVLIPGENSTFSVYGSYAARDGQYAWPEEKTGNGSFEYSIRIAGTGDPDLFDVMSNPSGNQNLRLLESESHMCDPAEVLVFPKPQIEPGRHILVVRAFDQDDNLAAIRRLKVQVRNRRRFF